MITIKKSSDLFLPFIPSPHLQLIQDCFQQLLDAYGADYDAENDGYLVYIEAGDDLEPVSSLALNHPLRDIPFEGSEYHPSAGCHEAILVTNNSFALTFIIPDEHLSHSTREALLSLS